MGQPEERKSFLEEAFEHRQRVEDTAPAHIPDDAAGAVVVEPPPEPEQAPDAEPSPEAELEPVADTGPVSRPLAALSPADRALTDEALKKSGLIWVRTAGSPGGQALWHVWTASAVHEDPCVFVVTGGSEQPDPGLAAGGDVVVVARSKDSTARLLTFEVRVERLGPDDPDWASATSELAKSRLNLHDSASAGQRWADDSLHALFRLVPNGRILERPGDYSAASHRAAPVATSATTAGAKPKVFHRRHGSGPPLS